MAIIYLCDKCGNQFGGPLDQISITDEHKVTTIYDLCAPCRGLLKEADKEKDDTFFATAIKKTDIKLNITKK